MKRIKWLKTVKRLRVAVLAAALCSLAMTPSGVWSNETPAPKTSEKQPIRVGVRDIKPFIFLDEENTVRGYSIDLWKAIAGKMNVSYEFIPENGIGSTLDAMRKGELDIAIGAITITQQREKEFDFSYSHYHTGLGIVTPIDPGYSVGAMLTSFFTASRLKRLGSFFLFLLVSAHIIWLVERRYQTNFSQKYFPGVIEGVYWSLVTASTVGYGDYVPKSKAGKAMALIIIIISLPLFGVFVANISSDITLHELRNVINGPQDLVNKRVGVVSGSSSEGFLARLGMTPGFTAPKAEQLYQLLELGEIDAVVQDIPSLQYYAANSGRDKVKIITTMFDKQDYAFLLPESSPLMEQLDQAMLNLVENGTETIIRNKWFGREQFSQQ